MGIQEDAGAGAEVTEVVEAEVEAVAGGQLSLVRIDALMALVLPTTMSMSHPDS